MIVLICFLCSSFLSLPGFEAFTIERAVGLLSKNPTPPFISYSNYFTFTENIQHFKTLSYQFLKF